MVHHNNTKKESYYGCTDVEGDSASHHGSWRQALDYSQSIHDIRISLLGDDGAHLGKNGYGSVFRSSCVHPHGNQGKA